MIAALLRKIPALPLIAGFTAVALLLAGMFAVYFEERSFQAEKIGNATAQAHILASIVTAALAFRDAGEVQEYLDSLRTDTDVQAAAIYDIAGNRVATFLRKGAEPSLQLIAASEPSLKNNTVTITRTINQRDLRVGTLLIRTEIEPLQRRLALYAVIVIFAVLTALIVIVLTIAYTGQRRSTLELGRRADALAFANRELQAQIAQRERAEAALQTSQKMEAMGRMTGGLAHDFNNLLHVLQLNLTALTWSKSVDADTATRESIEMCLKAVDRGAKLTQQLLAFGRRQPLSPRPFDVNGLIEQSTGLIYPVLGSNIDLRLQLSNAACWALADPHQFENALLNIAINARDAMPHGGTFTIATDIATLDDSEQLAPGNYVRICITDTGQGIAPELLDKVFEPFFSTKGAGKGSGLGLSQVYGYFKQSGGSVRLDSERGAGTQVTLLLPCTALVPEVRSKSIASAEETSIQELTMLIVEDEALILLSAETLIKRLGFNTVISRTGAEAIAQLESGEKIDVLFSDMQLPGGINGLQIAKRAVELHPSIKVLLTSGYAEQEIIAAEEMASFPLLRKPYGPANLIVELKKLSVME